MVESKIWQDKEESVEDVKKDEGGGGKIESDEEIISK